MRRVDVAVVGAGVFGLAAARALVRRGLSVRVVEAGRVGAGASGGIVGALSPHMPEAWNPKKAFQFRALMSARAFWADVDAASGLSSGYSRCGRILPLHGADAARLAAERARAAQALWQGAACFDVADAAHGVTGAHGVAVETLSARLYPARAVASLAAALRASGVEIAEGAPVTDPAGLDADRVVVAAGNGCAALVPQAAPLLRGVKGQAALLDIRLPDDMPVIFDDGVYIVPHGTWGTAIGSTSENSWSHDGTDDRLDAVIARAAAILPAVADAPVLSRWAGIRPRAARPDPVLGPVSDRLWLLTGGFKIGFGIAHETGEALAAWMDGGGVDMPDSFRLAHHLDRAAPLRGQNR